MNRLVNESIFHIAEPGDWAARTNVYSATSLETEGFIHCSTASQLSDVAERFFRDRTDLVLLTIDVSSVEGLLRYEDLYGVGEDFPHIYGPIPLSAVVASEAMAVPM